MTKHTPGPWDYAGTAGHETHGQSAIYDQNGKDIAIVYDGDANAALMAAAPELLYTIRLLETAARRYAEGKDNSPTYVIRICDQARAAIAMATGATD